MPDWWPIRKSMFLIVTNKTKKFVTVMRPQQEFCLISNTINSKQRPKQMCLKNLTCISYYTDLRLGKSHGKHTKNPIKIVDR